jgi:hypothetical protein
MPMIDVYTTDSTFADPGSLAQRPLATLMRIEEYSFPRIAGAFRRPARCASCGGKRVSGEDS